MSSPPGERVALHPIIQTQIVQKRRRRNGRTCRAHFHKTPLISDELRRCAESERRVGERSLRGVSHPPGGTTWANARPAAKRKQIKTQS